MQGDFFIYCPKDIFMLGILILIGIVVGFYKAAVKRELNGYLYGILSIVIWFVAQFLAAFALVLSDPTTSEGALIGFGILGSIIGVIILYFIMDNAGRKKAMAKVKANDELMDDSTVFDEDF